LAELFDDLPPLRIVEVGASAVDGEPAYQRLVNRGAATVIGFEPDPAECRKLQAQAGPSASYLPYAIGDGRDAMLHICHSRGMNSLYEPDRQILDSFQGFGDWGRVVGRQTVATRRLDDIDEIAAIDYLKLDVQGSELSILRGAKEKLATTLVVETEAQFIPFYKGQPLFAEVDQELRGAGFLMHRFGPMISRVFKPMLIRDDVYSGLSQTLWSDAVCVRRFTDFARLPSESLLKIALVVHDLYGSIDLAALALSHLDQREGTGRLLTYQRRLTSP
jgi:FkbM family methyltransferase